MNLEDDIPYIVLGFFDAINAEIHEQDGLYTVSIPKKYHNFFESHMIKFAFDEKTSSEANCELINTGSKTLSLVMESCCKKGPIALKKSVKNVGQMVIRYHFFITISGTSHTSDVDHVDVDLDSAQVVSISDNLEDAEFSLDVISPENIISSYSEALKEIKKRHEKTRSVFVSYADKRFLQDFELFVNTYNSRMREMDNTIRDKDNKSTDSIKAQEFRFKTLDEMSKIEKERNHLIQTLQDKHKILVEYRLIACEIILI